LSGYKKAKAVYATNAEINLLSDKCMEEKRDPTRVELLCAQKTDYETSLIRLKRKHKKLENNYDKLKEEKRELKNRIVKMLIVPDILFFIVGGGIGYLINSIIRIIQIAINEKTAFMEIVYSVFSPINIFILVLVCIIVRVAKKKRSKIIDEPKREL
jgi:hypothetical protein